MKLIMTEGTTDEIAGWIVERWLQFSPDVVACLNDTEMHALRESALMGVRAAVEMDRDERLDYSPEAVSPSPLRERWADTTRHERKRLKITLGQCAELLSCSVPHYSALERGLEQPTDSERSQLAWYFKRHAEIVVPTGSTTTGEERS
jgi:hypothetical protein